MAQIFAGLFLGGAGAYFALSQQAPAQPKTVDYEAIRDSIEEILPNPDHDDGNLGPLLVRLAWHASGTYDANAKNGGSNGATMRFKPELSDGANAGLNKAQKFLDPIKQKHPEISTADLWILASYVSIEYMGGPRIPFLPGRKDAATEAACPPQGRLPDATKGASHIRNVFNRMGLNDREMVLLIGGGHAIGRCHKDRSGFDGPWTNTPTTMSNTFFRELIDNTWTVRKWEGPQQYEDKSKRLMMLPADLELRDDKEFRRWSEVYKADKDQFLADFGETFKKLTELGFSANY